jgi:uncharacterized membrane protein YgcG
MAGYERFGIVYPDGERFYLRRWIELQRAFLEAPSFPGAVWALGTAPEEVELAITTTVVADCYQCGLCPRGVTYFCGPGCEPGFWGPRDAPYTPDYVHYIFERSDEEPPALITDWPRPDESGGRGSGSGGSGGGSSGGGSGSGGGDGAGSGPAGQPGA